MNLQAVDLRHVIVRHDDAGGPGGQRLEGLQRPSERVHRAREIFLKHFRQEVGVRLLIVNEDDRL